MDAKEKVLDLLNSLNINYKKIDHQPVYTIEDMIALNLDKEGTICKNLFLRDQKGKKHFLVVLRNDKQADLKKIAAQLMSTKLSFASEERLNKYIGLDKGAVSPFGIINDLNHEVEVAFDKDLSSCDNLGVHPNDNTSTVFISFDDINKIINNNGNKIKLLKI